MVFRIEGRSRCPAVRRCAYHVGVTIICQLGDLFMGGFTSDGTPDGDGGTRILGQAEGYYCTSPWHANVFHIGEKMSPIQMVYVESLKGGSQVV